MLKARVAAVVIGRNEGDRLRLCLESLIPSVPTVIYVDSGSRDSSVSLARKLGVTVVELDVSRPFTAARARNSGVAALRAVGETVDYVQFIDGDCQVDGEWICTGSSFLDLHPAYSVVCGRNRERFPEASIYNRLCELEWALPPGDASTCGGNAMMRLTAFEQVGGFNDTLIAGEEPELCVRLRRAGWKIMRLDAEMTLHDAAMSKFGQWWKRSKRAGYAYAQGAAMHGAAPERHWVRESSRIWVWGGGLPLLTLFLTLLLGPACLLLSLAYLLLWTRIFLRGVYERNCWSDAALWAGNCVLCKFPQLVGQVAFWLSRWTAAEVRPIEYQAASKT